MRTINIHAAKTHLSRLLEDVSAGEEIIIAKAGQPVARLVPLNRAAETERTLGGLAGQISLPPNFDDPLPDDFLAHFDDPA